MRQLYVNDTPTGIRVETADTVWRRLIGLMGDERGGRALFIPRCRSIHTCFMRYPIDALFLDREGVCLRTVKALRPWRLAVAPAGARDTLEIPSTLAAGLAITTGARILIRP